MFTRVVEDVTRFIPAGIIASVAQMERRYKEFVLRKTVKNQIFAGTTPHVVKDATVLVFSLTIYLLLGAKKQNYGDRMCRN